MSLIKFKELVSLTEFNTFRIKSNCRYYFRAKERSEIKEVYRFIKENNLKFFVLGGGSNILLPEMFDGVVIHDSIKTLRIINETEDFIYIKAGSGYDWDEFVDYCVEKGYYGLENLSYIPGTVGASPVQNISAYGSEIKEFIESVEVFDMTFARERIFTNKECYFSYRNSLFKINPNLVVVAVIFKLFKKPRLNLGYHDISQYLKKKKLSSFSAKDLRKLIIEIRKNKLPDPKDIPNAGSFFHNPILDRKFADDLLKEYDMPVYDVGQGKVKLSAGWLIENAGLKGYTSGRVGVYENHALVLVNYDNATQREILDFAQYIKDRVYSKFKVKLNIEPIIIT